MNKSSQNMMSGLRAFARDNPATAALASFAIAMTVLVLLAQQVWPSLETVRMPKVFGYAVAWFVAMASTLAIAMFLMWFHDRREVDRSRRTIRLNFDHSMLAMLDLARKFTTSIDRNQISAAIESSQKQLIAASARLKRYESRLTAFPAGALNAYADLENEIDVTLENLNEWHRKSRVERESKFPSFGFDVFDRLARFDGYLRDIHSHETAASRAVRLQVAELGEVPTIAEPVVTDAPVVIRRASTY